MRVRMAENDGKGLELLGSILAGFGWLFVVGALALSLPAFLSDAPQGRLAGISMLGVGIGAMALAGLGHLLRAVAQLGRNVRRLGELLNERAPPPEV